MRKLIVVFGALGAFVVAAGSVTLSGQTGAAATSRQPFKLGTFEIDGEQRVGMVLQDKLIVDIEAANRQLERNPVYPRIPMPDTMLDLIGQYEYGLKFRLYEIANDLAANKRLEANPRPRYIHDVAQVRTLTPIQYPRKILNTAVNFFSHVGEGGGGAEAQAKAVAARRANRGVPYMFLKPTEGVIIGNGDPIVLPHGRDRIDWEVELATVIGRTAKYVPATKAAEHIFGYMVMLDISDRGGRPPGGFSSGSDWFVGKGHDTFGPMGPWIVPKEFYGDPMKNLRQTLSVGTTQMQEGTAGDMIHSLYEVIEYASSIVTLFPGDVIGAGTSGGVGMGTTVRGKQVFLKAGDKIVAAIDGIGTLTHPVVQEPPPTPGTGSYLPPDSSYRKQ
jgi:2-keto-4-pentenoate hydratase/2-oxohepta-3-ene-1,7-dioic acid hydratase in catechol pathway